MRITCDIVPRSGACSAAPLRDNRSPHRAFRLKRSGELPRSRITGRRR
jgi:hypothetical protein